MVKIYLPPVGVVDKCVMDFLVRWLSSIWPLGARPAIAVPEEPSLGSRRLIFMKGAFNFIFGLAMGRRAVISLRRLNPEFYGGTPDQGLLNSRALKEAMHELAHVFGLGHCPDPWCLIHFSNSIEDTDRKDWRYCNRCNGFHKGMPY